MKRFVLNFFILLFLLQNVSGMTDVKEWILKIPGIDLVKDDSDQKKSAEEDKNKSRTLDQAEFNVLISLTAERERLDKKERELVKKERQLRVIEQRIEKRMDEISQSSNNLENERRQQQETDGRDISKIVKLYESIDPESASKNLNQMDRLTATHILMRMNPRKASAVLQLLDIKVAVEITENVTKFKENRQKAEKN